MFDASSRIATALTAAMFAVLPLLASCGGGTEVRIGQPPPVATGNLMVTISNLPPATNAAVRVTGPGGYAQDLSRTTALNGLTTGTYRISATPVVAGNISYSPVPPAQDVVVPANATVQASIQYAAAAPLALHTQVFLSGVSGAVFLTAPPDDPRQFIVERTGRIRVAQGGSLLAAPFLDISARVAAVGEGGLLSMAFAPDYATSGLFYVYYTDAARDIVVERHQVSADPNVARSTGMIEIIRIPHPNFSNHFGGLLAFGPGGHLYLATGDGGGAGDPAGNAQNNAVLLGKMLRLDVSNATAAAPYRIPTDNPFINQQGMRGEIWARGLRNPWRFTFDGGLLYIADVGQNQREEVNIAGATLPGLNYGWDIMEGTLCHGSSTCDRSGLTLPLFEYPRGEAGSCSIIGGFVYRGRAIPELQGHYLYSDYCAGFLRSFVWSGASVTQQASWTIPDPGNVVSFGQDGAGELYLVAENGSVYKIVRRASASP